MYIIVLSQFSFTESKILEENHYADVIKIFGTHSKYVSKYFIGLQTVKCAKIKK